MVGSLISLSRVPLAPAGAEPEPSISLRGDDGHGPGRGFGLAGVVRPCCDDELMSSTATSGAAVVSPAERVEVLFEELAELAGQRNAIDGRIV
ncbi:hypothetical protein GT32_21010 [Mycobacterium tuberculosis]|nr:hypothetical protein GT32_21010 [Mycobacterium tuberculosis]